MTPEANQQNIELLIRRVSVLEALVYQLVHQTGLSGSTDLLELIAKLEDWMQTRGHNPR